MYSNLSDALKLFEIRVSLQEVEAEREIVSDTARSAAVNFNHLLNPLKFAPAEGVVWENLYRNIVGGVKSTFTVQEIETLRAFLDSSRGVEESEDETEKAGEMTTRGPNETEK